MSTEPDTAPPCDCGHEFSTNPTWFHLGGQCAYLDWHARRGELDSWYQRGPDGQPLDDEEDGE